MALSFIQTNGDGVTTNFAIPFQYILQSHVHAYVDGGEVPFTWLNSALVQITPAPAAGTLNVELRRVTPKDEAIVDFNNGSTLSEFDLDATSRQSLFISQEYFEQSVNSFPSGHTLDSHSDATAGESTVKGAMRIYGTGSKTKAIIATDGGILSGDANTAVGAKFLDVGTHGQTLEVDTTQSGKLAWKQGLRNLIQAVGDLFVGGGFGSANTLTIGANNEVLVVDTTTSLKTKWSSIFYGGTYHGPTINAAALVGLFTGTYTFGGTPTLTTGTVSSSTITSCTINSSTLNSPAIVSPAFSGTVTGNAIGYNGLKHTTGSASGSISSGAPADDVATMNEFLLGYNLRQTGTTNGATLGGEPYANGNNNDYVPRVRIYANPGTSGWTVSWTIQWRYLTASDNPVIWLGIDQATGNLISTWTADDPLPGDIPAIERPDLKVVRLISQDLEHLTALNSKAQAAADHIQSKGLRMQHQAYRAMQLFSGQDAPSQWIFDNLRWNFTTGKLEVK